MDDQNRILDISWGTIFKITVGLFSVYLLYLIRDILIWFIFAIIISILFTPTIEFLQKRKVPRTLAVIFVYLATFSLLSYFIYSVASMFFRELQQFSQYIPEYFQTLSPLMKDLGIKAFENIESFTSSIVGVLATITSNIPNALFSFFGGIFTTIFVITISFFISVEQQPIEKILSLIFPKKHEAYALSLWNRAQKRVSDWFLTRVLGSLFVGFFSYIAFLIYDTKYPLTLGFLAGVLNFVPVIGPFITGILIFIVGSLDSVLRGTILVIIFTLVQQIENNIVTPLLSKKFFDLSPALVLISVVVGGKLWGFLGSILSIPLFGILFEFLRDFLKKKKEGGSDNS